MKVIVFGGDGFCGWPTTLRLAKAGHKVMVVDNLSRRAIDDELSSGSLTKIANIRDRVAAAQEKIGDVEFCYLDIAAQPSELRDLIKDFLPDAVVQFAEQRAAPYSMIGDRERRYTVDNNIVGTHNICSAIVDVKPDTHIIHLGTMGVYGYSKKFGKIPEGYLGINITQTKEDTEILYPANPGSVYHMTKCLDQLIFQFYNKNWGLKITDLHQGIVWGVETPETKLDTRLVNRFDYDGIYGTVLNRFISQAANNVPLTVYGTGGQSRAFIHISDTAECIKLSVENDVFDNSRVRIFNQVSEVKSVAGLAEVLRKIYNADVQFVDNPRKELAENELEVSNSGLRSLGFEPVMLDEALIDDVRFVADQSKVNFNKNNVLTSPKW
ncbi:NAD-dependent epimerase/dehydratase family protein [Halomonas sp.]|uniref:NAD-dependent epimerase/dehydratase family protein n=1 Tax=Halomonas sp. TaxID=1486246 RepID=UPI00298E0063|nr:NAD-dependent epimerase/dehydratase family protein [Halomonas sp.]MDW7663136.1 NAD-dependent epimerase/dehydratase family protein [Bacillota bacterium]MDW7749082.1 NAD-dependent epimerase/dehydratase family protein [Halomonas sp.]